MNHHAAKGLTLRIYVVLILLGVGAGGILARAAQIQIWNAPRLRELAQRQQRHTIELRARRGDILDSRGEPLAVSREEAQVYARPEEIKNQAETARRLSGILQMDERALRARIGSGDAFIWLTRTASLRQAEAVKTLALPGVGILPASRRFYPGGTIAANLLGFTGLDGKGLEGLEYYYESRLAGRPIQLWLERDARGAQFLLTDRSQAVAGNSADRVLEADSRGATLKLTILRPLQYLAERELEKGVLSSGARAGCVVAMEPDSGRVLALASYPTYDPNHFSDFSQQSFRNRCLVGASEPGSTFKVFVVAAAREKGLIGDDQRFFCENGAWQLAGATIRDTKPHGWMSVRDIIAQSSNIGAAKIGSLLGQQQLQRAISAFGFGGRTGIDFPGESAGLLVVNSRWSPVEVATVSFGQGLAVTPLQLVSAVSVIANGGNLMRPYLVESVIPPDGVEQPVNRPTRIRRVISAETAARVTRYMEAVVSSGTGTRAAVSGYTVAGKTGTAQKARENSRGYAEGKYVSSFLGFLPARRPRLAMIVVLDEPNPEYAYGGWVAAPIFQAVAKQAMVLLKVPGEDGSPSIAELEPEAGEVAAETEAQARIRQWKEARAWNAGGRANGAENIVPDLRGLTLRQALRVLGEMQLQVEVSGLGTVAEQNPEPGSAVRGGQLMRLKLEETL